MRPPCPASTYVPRSFWPAVSRTCISPEPDTTLQIPVEGVNLEELMNDYERRLLLEALRPAGGVKKKAAQLLGISFRSFRYRMEKLGLDDPKSGDS